MMRPTSLIVLLGSLLILASCAKPLPPEFRKFDKVMVNPTMPDIDIVLQVGVDAIVFNPNKSKFKVEEIDAELFVEGKTVGKIQEILNTSLEGNQESRVPISFKQEVGSAFKGDRPSMAELAGNRTVNLKLVGVLKGEKGVNFPIDQSMQFEIPVKLILNYLLNNRNR